MDTLSITEELVAAGMPEPQAKVIAKTQVASAKDASEGLVTKSDLNAGLEKLRADIASLLVWAVAGTITANTAIVALLLSLFHNAPK